MLESWATSFSSKWFRASIAVVLWVLAFLGASGVQAFFPSTRPVNWYAWELVRYGLLAAGVLLLFLPVEWFCRRMTERWRESVARSIQVRYVKAEEAEEAYKLCWKFYTREDHVINRDSLAAFLKANPNTAKIFSKNGKAVGLYIIFAIKKAAVRKILDGTIQTAQDLNEAHAVSAWQKATGLYVTNVAAEGIMNRGVLMQQLEKDLATYVTRYPSIKFVFARMANADGSRILRKNGFTKTRQTSPDTQIWKYEVGPNLPKGIHL